MVKGGTLGPKWGLPCALEAPVALSSCSPQGVAGSQLSSLQWLTSSLAAGRSSPGPLAEEAPLQAVLAAPRAPGTEKPPALELEAGSVQEPGAPGDEDKRVASPPPPGPVW